MMKPDILSYAFHQTDGGHENEAGTFTIMDELMVTSLVREVKIHHTQEPKTRNALALFFHARLSVATVLHRLLLLRRLHIVSGVSSLIFI
ncbi:hypothetical protein L2E82_06659 [Cichorium intybus]|uniref:Uncharacterized protein n=1 Tax=Cichorium intybus TaxID=13427 RepID=A0ACB9HAP1_CICIN|nr:hypothetical protein L2E82_06659 [Cichorium intybus]